MINLLDNVLLSTLNMETESHLRNAKGWISGITVSILETKVGRVVTIGDSKS